MEIPCDAEFPTEIRRFLEWLKCLNLLNLLKKQDAWLKIQTKTLPIYMVLWMQANRLMLSKYIN